MNIKRNVRFNWKRRKLDEMCIYHVQAKIAGITKIHTSNLFVADRILSVTLLNTLGHRIERTEFNPRL